MAGAYVRSVLPALRTTKGCVFASLLQDLRQPQECVSLTIWNSRRESEAYEQSGLYERLLALLRPHFAESTEWKLGLSGDLSLEYTPMPVEPVIERFEEAFGGVRPAEASPAAPFAVEVVTLGLRDEGRDNLERAFATVMHPKFQSRKGFISLILLLDRRIVHIISLWDERVEINPSTGIYPLRDLLATMGDLVPAHVRDNAAAAEGQRTSASSDDVSSRTFRCLASEWFR